MTEIQRKMTNIQLKSTKIQLKLTEIQLKMTEIQLKLREIQPELARQRQPSRTIAIANGGHDATKSNHLNLFKCN